MSLVAEHRGSLGVAPACRAVGLCPATYYRQRAPMHGPHRRRQSPRALAPTEQRAVLDALHSQRFVDQAPAQVVATLLDEDRYLCSERTMYRLLASHGEVRERRAQLRHPSYQRPELLATGPNQLWSWDTCTRQAIRPGQLTLHADRGASMRSKPVALLLADLGVTKTHSRPNTSDDNPYSEAHFKTLKYRPGCPIRFGSLQHARQWAAELMRWYNAEHHHSALGLMTPEQVHYGLAQGLRLRRQQVLQAAYSAHPERFVGGTPVPPALQTQVWINQPKEITQ